MTEIQASADQVQVGDRINTAGIWLTVTKVSIRGLAIGPGKSKYVDIYVENPVFASLTVPLSFPYDAILTVDRPDPLAELAELLVIGYLSEYGVEWDSISDSAKSDNVRAMRAALESPGSLRWKFTREVTQ